MRNFLQRLTGARSWASCLMVAALFPLGFSITASASSTLPDFSHVKPAPGGGPFSLQSDAGLFRLSDLDGEVVVLLFGFLSCPDICPTTMQSLQQAAKELPDADQQRLRILFVTLDPDRDTPELLTSYLNSFALRAVGLTGTEVQIARVAEQYGVSYVRQRLTRDSYTIDHSSAIYLIDARGTLQRMLRYTSPPKRIASELRNVMHGKVSGRLRESSTRHAL